MAEVFVGPDVTGDGVNDADITPSGSLVNIDGVVFTDAINTGSGTGNYNTFLAISDNDGIEEGFNSDDTPPIDNSNKDIDHAKTHTVKLSDLVIVTVNGVQYYEFRVDLNESNSDPNAQISLDQFKLYSSANGGITDTTTLFSQNLIYDMDAGGNKSVLMSDAESSGSGTDDYAVLVPITEFAGLDPTTTYVYLYVQMGAADPVDPDTWDATATFEEWNLQNGVTLTGTKFEDLDGDGIKDDGEGPVEGVTIFIDANKNGTLDAGERTTLTDANGNYTFFGVATGQTVWIDEVVPAGATQTTGTHEVVVIGDATPGSTVVVDPIGNFIPHPAISITKAVHDVDGDTTSPVVDEAGDVVNYTIDISNTGNVTLTGLLTEDQVEILAAVGLTPVLDGAFNSGDTNDNGAFDPGETWHFTAAYTVTQDDIDGNGGGDGILANIARADTVQTNQVSDDADVPIELNPALSITKDASDYGDCADTVGETSSTRSCWTTPATWRSTMWSFRTTSRVAATSRSPRPMTATASSSWARCSSPATPATTASWGSTRPGPTPTCTRSPRTTSTATAAATARSTISPPPMPLRSSAAKRPKRSATMRRSTFARIRRSRSPRTLPIMATAPTRSARRSSTRSCWTTPATWRSTMWSFRTTSRVAATSRSPRPMTATASSSWARCSSPATPATTASWGSTRPGPTPTCTRSPRTTSTATAAATARSTISPPPMPLRSSAAKRPKRSATMRRSTFARIRRSRSPRTLPIMATAPTRSARRSSTRSCWTTPATWRSTMLVLQDDFEGGGNVTLTPSDDGDGILELGEVFLTGDTGDDGVMGVDETWTYTYLYAVTQDDIDSNGGGNGTLDNIATANATAVIGGEAAEEVSDDEAVDVCQDPALSITKDASDYGDCADTVGETILYTIVLDNTGNVALDNVVLQDDFEGGGNVTLTPSDDGDGILELGEVFLTGDTGDDGVMGVDETWTYTYLYAVTQDDIDSNGGGNGTLDNIATANATAVIGGEAAEEVSDDATVEVCQDPLIDLEKYVNVNPTAVPPDALDANWDDADAALGPQNVNLGTDVWFKVTLENTGNVTLTDVDVTDNNTTGGLPGTFFDLVVDGQLTADAINNHGATLDGDTDGDNQLDVDETWTIIYSQAFDPGNHVNEATVTAEATTTAEEVTDDDLAHYFSLVDTGLCPRTPGFWQNPNNGAQFWDGIEGNEKNAGQEGFPEGELLYAVDSNNDGFLNAVAGDGINDDKPLDQKGLLIGDYNKDGFTGLDEDTLFVSFANAQTLINASNKQLNGSSGDGRFMLGRDMVASWLNYLQGSGFGEAGDPESPRHYLDDSIDWMQIYSGTTNGGTGETFDTLKLTGGAIKTNTSTWKDAQSGFDHSAGQMHSALDYYNNTGQTEPGGTHYANCEDEHLFEALSIYKQTHELV